MLGLLALPVAGLVALGLAAWPWTAAYDRRPAVRLLASLVATSAAVVGLQVLLGAFGVLGPASLGALAATATLGALLVWRLGGGRAYDWRPAAAPPTPFGVLLGVLAAAAYAALVLVAALVPPWGWDTLVYHLTAVFFMAQTGGLEPFPSASAQFYFPLAGELHSSWFFLLSSPLSGGGAESWRVTGIALAPLGLTAAVAVRVAAVGLGLRAALPWLAPAVLLTPLLLIQPLAGYVDAAFAAFLLAAFAFAVLAAAEGRPAHLAMAALAAGLALGTKLSFLYLGLPIVLVLLGRRPWRALRGPAGTAWVALSALLFSIGCGFWLGRNALRHGNPLYPVELRLGSRTLLAGQMALEPESDDRQRFVRSAPAWLAYPFGERFLGRLQYTVDNGFGALFAAGLVLSPLALSLAVRRRRWLLARALAGLPLLLLVWFVVSPWEHPRYALAAVGLALLVLAAVYEEIAAAGAAGPRRLAQGAIAVALLFSATAGLLAAAPGLSEVAAAWRAGVWRPRAYYASHYGAAAAAFDWLTDQGGSGTTVSFDRDLWVAPLFGWHGRNRVVWASSADDRRVDAAPFVADAAEWRGFLRREGVDWFVVWRPWWQQGAPSSRPRRWLETDPRGFSPAAAFPPAGEIWGVESRPTNRPNDSGRSRPLDELAAADRWVVEFREGAEGRALVEGAAGVRVDYRFDTPGNDYLDLRVDLIEGGWPESAALVFELESAPAPALLFVYLKEADGRRACRFRVDLTRGGARRVRLALAAPEWRSGEFDPRRVAALHLVLDDADDAAAFESSIRMNGFRLELDREAI